MEACGTRPRDEHRQKGGGLERETAASPNERERGVSPLLWCGDSPNSNGGDGPEGIFKAIAY